MRGRRLAIDVGSVRVGVAACDPDGILATPVETVARARQNHPQAADVLRIAELVDEYEPAEVIVGLPRTLRGTEGTATKTVRRFVRVLADVIAPVPVLFADERFSTVTAQQALHASGVDTRRGRSVIDQAAAVAILQDWIDSRTAQAARAGRSDGRTAGDATPGVPVEAPGEEPGEVQDEAKDGE